MKVYIKNKVFSFGGSSKVYNEMKETIFIVKGKFFSPSCKKMIYDTQKNLLYVIKNRLFNFFGHKVYIFDNKKNKLATIKKGKWSFSANYSIEDCIDAMEISGKHWKRTSQIFRNGQVIGTIKNNFDLFKDSFTLEADEKDIPFLTALVIAFDNIRDSRSNDND